MKPEQDVLVLPSRLVTMMQQSKGNPKIKYGEPTKTLAIPAAITNNVF